MSDDTPTERHPAQGANGDGSGADGTAADDATRAMPTPNGNDTPTELVDQVPDAQTGDDMPTARLVYSGVAPAAPVGSDAPTQAYVPYTPPRAPEPAAATPPPPPIPEEPTSHRRLRVAAIVVGTLIAAAIIVLVLVFTTRDDETVAAPEASATPTPTAEAPAEPAPAETPAATPTPTPSETPTPTPTPSPIAGATFTSFAPEDNSVVECPDEESSVPLFFEWASDGAAEAWIGAATDDAQAEPIAEVDPNGSYDGLVFDCSLVTEDFTVTLDNGAGTVTHATVTLVRQVP
ncbi:hypothetical protein [Marisediminicola senii]|uniref:hypothetical protein n=1 Tax=Marisediminicola senii TaxID=2711233 RepID=UPI001912BB46|nr:hypothetical protein [Marisediminicola senii]